SQASGLGEETAYERPIASVLGERIDVAQRRDRPTNATGDELFESVELDTAPGVRRRQTGVRRSVQDHSLAALRILDVILEVLNLIVDSRVVEHLLFVRI